LAIRFDSFGDFHLFGQQRPFAGDRLFAHQECNLAPLKCVLGPRLQVPAVAGWNTFDRILPGEFDWLADSSV
jgi:hypothetical protein